MKYILFCAIFVFVQTLVPVAGVCQSESPSYHYRDKIVLKNNHLLVGQIIRYTPDTLLFELNSGSRTIFLTDQIKRVSQYTPGNTDKGTKLSVMKNPDKTHSIAINHGLIFGGNDDEVLCCIGQELAAMYKYNTHKNHVLVAGIGVQSFDLDSPFAYFPVTLGYEYHVPVKMQSSLYVSLLGGYAFPFSVDDEWITENKGGWHLNPNIGILFATNGRVGYFMEAGVKIQKAKYQTGSTWWGTSEFDIIYRRISLRFGIIF